MSSVTAAGSAEVDPCRGSKVGLRNATTSNMRARALSLCCPRMAVSRHSQLSGSTRLGASSSLTPLRAASGRLQALKASQLTATASSTGGCAAQDCTPSAQGGEDGGEAVSLLLCNVGCILAGQHDQALGQSCPEVPHLYSTAGGTAAGVSRSH